MAWTICVIGSLNVDLVTFTSRVPNGGETLTSDSFTTGWGGKGANQAVAAAKISSSSSSSVSLFRVQMVGAVGNDHFGPDLKRAMNDEGVDTTDVRVVEGEKTGVAVILVETSTGENRILVNAGANATVLPPTLTPILDFTHSKPSLIVMQLEIPLETVLHVCERAAEHSIAVLLNPAPAIPLPDSIYANIRVLVVNETEASMLSGVPTGTTEAGIISRAYEAAAKLSSKGCPIVVVTLGALGAVLYARPSYTRGSADARNVHIHPKKVNVVDTTAAGDTFIGAFSVMFVRTWAAKGGGSWGSSISNDNDFELAANAVRFAVSASAWTVRRKGTWDAMPRPEDVRQLWVIYTWFP